MTPAPRMTTHTLTVVGVLLDADTEQFGLQIIRSCGLAAGTVYPILQRLHAAGWVTAQWEPEEHAQREGRPARRYYQLSALGRARATHALAGPNTRPAPLARLLAMPHPHRPAVEHS